MVRHVGLSGAAIVPPMLWCSDNALPSRFRQDVWGDVPVREDQVRLPRRLQDAGDAAKEAEVDVVEAN